MKENQFSKDTTNGFSENERDTQHKGDYKLKRMYFYKKLLLFSLIINILLFGFLCYSQRHFIKGVYQNICKTETVVNKE